MDAYRDFHRRSIADRDAFWRTEAALVDWQTPFASVLDYAKPPFAKWFVGGRTNLCHNASIATSRRAASRRRSSTSRRRRASRRTYTYRELAAEVNRVAAAFIELGVGRGDRVLIYMPMIAEAAFAMLACARIGAVHSVVFGGFAAASLATRIDDARPRLMVTSDAGMRAGKAVPYKHLVDEAMRLARNPPQHVLIVNRGLDAAMTIVAGRDVDYATLRARHLDAQVPCEWLESSAPSYILYTSGTTGKPKGVQRDTGGYAVALASSMRRIFCVAPGEAMFTTSDIGWVVGHSYIVYAPLINGSTTILYEGLPIRPDPAIWWKIVEENGVRTMFSSPTAIRVLKKQDPGYMKRHDLSSLRYLFLAGEPLDEPTARWAADSLGVAIVDNYWQTETGWPILSAQPGVEETARKFGSPSFPVYGYDVRLLHEATGEEVGTARKACSRSFRRCRPAA
jgi:propionyl-CoA synthetase